MTTHIATPDCPEIVNRLFSLEEGLINDPYPVYAQMRAESPVVRWGPLVAVSRYDDVKAVLRDPGTFSSQRHGGSRSRVVLERLSGEDALKLADVQANEGLISQTDDPQHARMRRFVNQAFSATRMAEMREQIEDITRELLDAAEERGDRTLELVDDLAYKMPLHVICTLLGASGPETQKVRHWSDAIGVAIGTEYSNLDTAYEAVQEFKAFVGDLIAKVRQSDGQRTDLFAELVSTDDEGTYLTESDLTAIFINLLFAGHETTTNLIGNSVIELLTHPEQQQLLVDDPTRIRGAIEELMRYCGSIHTIHRVATRDCDIAGFPVTQGETVRLMLAAANHDGSRFDDPETLDLSRKDARHHLGFGYGIHTCLGMWLTRLEVEVALSEILVRYPELALAGPIERHRNITLYGPTRLDLTY